jgi:hypothetical protein
MSGEVNMTTLDQEWIKEMAQLIKERENCERAINRWLQKKNDLESAIAAMRAAEHQEHSQDPDWVAEQATEYAQAQE